MAVVEWRVPRAIQPKPEDYTFDLDRALSCVVTLSAVIPADAFTAETLGTERAGNGVVVREDGLVLTIGYLVTEAETVWLAFNDGRVLPAHVVLVDAETGFGLLQILERGPFPFLPIGRSHMVQVGAPIILAGGGGRPRAVAGSVAAKEEFAGYWEYLLDEAFYTAPSHPNWGGTALISSRGELVGIGSLQVQRQGEGDAGEDVNVCVPTDLLPSPLDLSWPNRAARPWLGFYVTEADGQATVAGLAEEGPAAKAGLQAGDTLVAVGKTAVGGLPELYRAVWACGPAGATVPLRVRRGDRLMDIAVTSVDRRQLLKRPRLH